MNMLLSKATRLLNPWLLIRVSYGAILLGYYFFYLCQMKLRGLAPKFLGHFRLTEQEVCVLLSVYGRPALQLERLRMEDKPVTSARSSPKVRRHSDLWCPYGPILIGVHPHFMEIDRHTLSQRQVRRSDQRRPPDRGGSSKIE
jgi:hypothetical protein